MGGSFVKRVYRSCGHARLFPWIPRRIEPFSTPRSPCAGDHVLLAPCPNPAGLGLTAYWPSVHGPEAQSKSPGGTERSRLALTAARDRGSASTRTSGGHDLWPSLTASCDTLRGPCGPATLAAACSVDSRTGPETRDGSAIPKERVAPCAPKDLPTLTEK
jgi:hypothetical protein